MIKPLLTSRMRAMTVGEVANQERFFRRSLIVNQMVHFGSKLTRKELWNLVGKAI